MSQASTITSNALHHYFSQDATSPALENTLIIQGTHHRWLKSAHINHCDVICHLASDHNQWHKHGFKTVSESNGTYDTIIHFATKFAHENLANLGKYSQQLTPHGRWLSICPNRMGASRLKKDIQSLFQNVQSTSKSKCRIFECQGPIDLTLARKWASLNENKPISNTPFVTRPGIFSAEKIDTGSTLLADILQQESWHGRIADLGAGYGFLSKSLLDTPRNRILAVDLYEIDKRALECAKINLDQHDNTYFHWCDVTQEVPHEKPFNWVIMNPPFHDSQDQNFELGKTFITQAAHILKPGGGLYLVANIHLPYETLIRDTFRSHRILKEDKGFKCIFARL